MVARGWREDRKSDYLMNIGFPFGVMVSVLELDCYDGYIT